jgi:16S rRNA (cytosine967-C5)-methyltransferase
MMDSEPRDIACRILNARALAKTTLDLLISDQFDPVFQKMDRRDKNLTFALVYGVLRTRGRLDWILNQFAKKGVDDIHPEVLNILRVALFQVFFMTRIPESAAVNTAVELSKKTSPPWVVRFVNGLLRGILRRRDNIAWPDKTADPLLWLSVEQSFPKWMLKRWASRYGFDQTEALCRFFNTIPPLSLRTNTLKTTRDNLMAILLPFSEKVMPAPFAPEGIQVYGLTPSVHELDPFQQGLFQVQDEAAQLVSHVLDPRPNETILDACAGLGGKTGHIAQLMENKGAIIALDSHAGRLEKLKAQMGNLGISIISVLRHDLNKPLDPSMSFDRVLLDAPCSGTGVIRRNPDTRWAIKQKDFSRYRKNQLQYMVHAALAVRPGGTLVYSVCSIEPEETDDVVAGFLEKHPEFARTPLPGPARDFPGVQVEKEGQVRSSPHVDQMDGFFIAALKKSL